jgi:hypothetical protein
MSRLLFAAARGARIQYRSPIDRNWKESAFRLWPDLHDCKTADSLYRIHPNDEHLAYGPISTALREVALTRNFKDSDIPYVRVEFEREDGYWSSTEEQRRVFCLILAEALADDGL